jgi:DNA-directed RNA polymerase subunit RPC12/RpoP
VKLTPARKATLARTYGLSVAAFEALWAYQFGRCALCGKRFTTSRTPHVDHDHRSGIIRGLACHYCNYTVLPMLRDDPDFFARVAAYLRYPPAVTAIGEHRVPGAPPPQQEVEG